MAAAFKDYYPGVSRTRKVSRIKILVTLWAVSSRSQLFDQRPAIRKETASRLIYDSKVCSSLKPAVSEMFTLYPAISLS